MDRRTKIVVTIGPASSDRKTILQMFKAGANVFRLNFSHSTYEEHEARINLLRDISIQLDRPITLLQDLQGPKIRTGELASESVSLEQGKSLILTTRPMIGNNRRIFVDFPDLPNYVKP